MNASTKTQSALRAALKQEDASLTERLPVAAQTPVAAPAEKSSEPAAVTVTEAAMEAAVAAPAKAAKAVKAKAAGSKTTRAEAAKSRPAKAVANPPSTSPVSATATEPAAPAQGKPTRKAVRATAVVVESDAPAKKGSARTTPVDTDGGKKEKREKVVRDSFSIPANEHRRIKSLREQVGKAGRLSSKSEVLRAGLHLLGERSTSELVAMLDALPAVVKGKRSKKH